MNILDIYTHIKREYTKYGLSPEQIRNTSIMTFEQINFTDNLSEKSKLYLIVLKLSKLSQTTDISLDELLDLLDLLLSEFNLKFLRQSSINFDFSSLNLHILSRIQVASINDLLNAVIRLTGHQIEGFNEMISVIYTKLLFEMTQIFSQPNPRTLNQHLRLLKKVLNIPEFPEKFKTHFKIFLINSSKYLTKQYEANSILSKTEIRIQKKLKSLSKNLEISLPESFQKLPPPSRRSRVLNEVRVEPKVALYSRSIQNDYDITIYRIYENGMYFAVKEYSRIASAKARKIIAKEVEILEKLSKHANDDNCFIRVYDVKNNNNMISIVMDYYELDLKKKIKYWKKNNIEPEELEVKTIIKKLIECFAELQENKIFHRDIKPQNILITSKNQPKIIDFNVSYKRQLNELTISIQQATVIGTPSYMAPELIELGDEGKMRGEFNIVKADVFSLGLTFWELISLEETNGRYSEKRTKELLEEIKASRYSEWIKTLLDSMLRLNPKERKTFKELLSVFEDSDTMMSNF